MPNFYVPVTICINAKNKTEAYEQVLSIVDYASEVSNDDGKFKAYAVSETGVKKQPSKNQDAPFAHIVDLEKVVEEVIATCRNQVEKGRSLDNLNADAIALRVRDL